LAVGLVLSVIGVSILTSHPILMTRESLTTSYNKPFEGKLCMVASFNSSVSKTQFAWFQFGFAHNNQTFSPLYTTVSFAGT